MAEAQKKSAVVTIRAKSTIALPPGQLGFSDLLEPKAFGTDPAKFNLDYHLTPAAIQAMPAVLLAKCVEPNLAALLEAVKENGGREKPAMDLTEWMENGLKDPKPKARVQLPFLKIKQNGFRKSKSGEMIANTIACWDKEDNLLDLKALRLAQGSVVQAIVWPNLFASKAAGWVPTPSLKLVGIRVLAAKQFGGGGGVRAPGEAADDEAIKAILGRDFEGQDLTQFALGSEAPAHGHSDNEDDQDPADTVKEMF